MITGFTPEPAVNKSLLLQRARVSEYGFGIPSTIVAPSAHEKKLLDAVPDFFPS